MLNEEKLNFYLQKSWRVLYMAMFLQTHQRTTTLKGIFVYFPFNASFLHFYPYLFYVASLPFFFLKKQNTVICLMQNTAAESGLGLRKEKAELHNNRFMVLYTCILVFICILDLFVNLKIVIKYLKTLSSHLGSQNIWQSVPYSSYLSFNMGFSLLIP